VATSANDLLDEAQAQIWALAQELPARARPRRAEARAAFAAQVAAWPGFARAALRVLDATDRSGERSEVRQTLVRLASSSIRGSRDVAPDAHLVRAAALLGAGADAVTAGLDAAVATDLGTRDRVLAAVESAARFTGAYAEHTSTRGANTAARWLALSAQAGGLIETTPVQRRSDSTATPILGSQEAPLVAAVDRWRRSAQAILAPSPQPSASLPRVATSLAIVYAAAAQASDVSDHDRGSHRASARMWAAASKAWPPHVQIPGRPDEDLHHAVTALRAGLVGAGRSAERDTATAAALQYADQLGTLYAARVVDVVDNRLAVISARRLVSELERPIPTDVIQAARSGRWVPLPTHANAAQAITSTALAAVRQPGVLSAPVRTAQPELGMDRYTRDADPLTGGGTLDPEAAAARRASAAGFSRSTRAMLSSATNSPAVDRVPRSGPAQSPEQNTRRHR